MSVRVTVSLSSLKVISGVHLDFDVSPWLFLLFVDGTQS